jgi:hypothetical protein
MRYLSRLTPLALVLAWLLGPGAGLASATTIEDLLRLKSGKVPVSDDVLIALIESDGSVFNIGPEDLKPLKEKGFSDKLIIAMILTKARTRDTLVRLDPPITRTAPPALPPVVTPPPPVEVNVTGPGGTMRYPVSPENEGQQPQQQAPVIVNITQQVTQSVEAPQQQPYYNPVYYPVVYPVYPVAPIVRRPIEPIYWGFNGQRRPDTWAPTRGEIRGQIPRPAVEVPVIRRK